MSYDDAQEKVYHTFLKTINDEPPLGDELVALAAQDALAEAYSLDDMEEAYGLDGMEGPASLRGKTHTRGVAAGQTGCPVARGRPKSKGKPPCRA